MHDVNPSDDIIDSRSVIDDIDELEALDERDDDEEAVLAALKALAEQGETLADWQYGETLIRDSYFTEYAKDLADDIGAIDRDANWPLTHIDWEAAADDLKQDYTELDFDGVAYWGR
jgi:antirestriction protein